MSFDILHVIKLGWPILSVLAVFSIVTLAVFLQSFSLLSRARRGADLSDKPAASNALETLDTRLALLGTIANAAPFVGLLGTVVGIIRAFHTIALNTGGGITTVAGGISEALVSTAAGLAVAIPASMIYNYFTHHSGRLARQAGLE
jgi:biopolymer transport protein ExbB